jgi:hypothetical protein
MNGWFLSAQRRCDGLVWARLAGASRLLVAKKKEGGRPQNKNDAPSPAARPLSADLLGERRAGSNKGAFLWSWR